MAIALALFEGMTFLLAVGATAFLAPRWPAPHGSDVGVQVGQALTFSLCCVLSFYYADLYDLRRIRSFHTFSKRLPCSLLAWIALSIAWYTAFPGHRGLGHYGVSSCISLSLSLGVILLFRGTFYAVLNTRCFTKRAVILGVSSLAQDIAKEIEAAPHLRYTIVGFVEDELAHERACETSSHLPYARLGPLTFLRQILKTYDPDCIIVALTERRQRLPIRELLESYVIGIEIKDGLEVYERFTGKLAIERMVPSFLIFSKHFKKSKR